jgi:hypothetical protein
MKNELQDFQQYLPIIEALCNNGLKTRHNNEISKIIQVDITEKDKNLQELK